MILLALLQAAVLPLPVIDHSKAVPLRPISTSVVMCASPEGLALARLAAKALDDNGIDYGFDTIMRNGHCMEVFNTDPVSADFQEDVRWAGALQPPKMLHGELRVVRVRVQTSNDPYFNGRQFYYYIAAEDLRL